VPDPKTEELSTEQHERLVVERRLERDADLPADERAHKRRADKAAYLRDKLAERAAAEDEARRR
jgi:hypothetical protein